MSKGSVNPLWILICAVMAVTCGAVECGLAQTSPEQCALDSLVLLAPDEYDVNIRLSDEGSRFGAIIHWEEPPDEDATCATIRDPELLPLPVNLTGTYSDNIDRELQFFSLQDGDVGSPDQNRLIMGWFNVFVSRSGSIEGEINLSNNVFGAGDVVKLTALTYTPPT